MAGEGGRATFTVLLDEQPLTWTVLGGEWYRRDPRAQRLSAAVPLLFDVARALPREKALPLLEWLAGWVPAERLRLEPEVPWASA